MSYSGSVDKLTAAGVILSGAAANDMEVAIYVLLQAARAFRKDIGDNPDKLNMAENAELKEEFLESLKKLNVKTWVEFFKEAKSLTNVKIHICGLAGKVWGAEKLDDFINWPMIFAGIGCLHPIGREEDSTYLFN